MKKNFLPLLLLFTVCSFTAGQLYIVATVQPFNWLQGSWQMQTRRGIITEKWVLANDSTLAGESSMRRADGSVIPLEKIELLFRNGKYYYIPTVKNQNGEQPVEFSITTHNETGFVAENPQHDFPKRISYTLINKDSIQAMIDDGATVPAKKSTFFIHVKKSEHVCI